MFDDHEILVVVCDVETKRNKKVLVIERIKNSVCINCGTGKLEPDRRGLCKVCWSRFVEHRKRLSERARARYEAERIDNGTLLKSRVGKPPLTAENVFETHSPATV